MGSIRFQIRFFTAGGSRGTPNNKTTSIVAWPEIQMVPAVYYIIRVDRRSDKIAPVVIDVPQSVTSWPPDDVELC